jgi:hypothetical protein
MLNYAISESDSYRILHLCVTVFDYQAPACCSFCHRPTIWAHPFAGTVDLIWWPVSLAALQSFASDTGRLAVLQAYDDRLLSRAFGRC